MRDLIGLCAFCGTIGVLLQLVSLLARRVATVRRIYGLGAVAYWLLVVSSIAWNARADASGMAGLAAIYTWLWWRSGGGDDTKRRLRRLRGRFAGMRRTAPAAA
jgi:hypothetical protein